jgi:hypothetical protein
MRRKEVALPLPGLNRRSAVVRKCDDDGTPTLSIAMIPPPPNRDEESQRLDTLSDHRAVPFVRDALAMPGDYALTSDSSQDEAQSESVTTTVRRP